MRRKRAIIWVNQYNYRWAPMHWPNRDVRISRYLAIDELEITKPGYMQNKARKRRVKMDMKFVDKMLKGAHLIKEAEPFNPEPNRGTRESE